MSNSATSEAKKVSSDNVTNKFPGINDYEKIVNFVDEELKKQNRGSLGTNTVISTDFSGGHERKIAPKEQISDQVTDLINSLKNEEIDKYFLSNNKWIGNVIAIHGASFTAKLTDLKDPTTHEIADFQVKEVTQDDKEFLNIGNSFYWNIGYSTENGQVEKKSNIRFQRISKWNVSDYDNAIDRAEEFFNNMIEKNNGK